MFVLLKSTSVPIYIYVIYIKINPHLPWSSHHALTDGRILFLPLFFVLFSVDRRKFLGKKKLRKFSGKIKKLRT